MEITNTFNSITVVLNSLLEQFTTLSLQDVTNNSKMFLLMSDTTKKLISIIQDWEQQWSSIVESKIDLGTITVYNGSIFKPQCIPVLQLLHHVLSDIYKVSSILLYWWYYYTIAVDNNFFNFIMQILVETKELMSCNPDTVQITQNIVDVVAISYHLCEMKKKDQLRNCTFPSEVNQVFLEDIKKSLYAFQRT